MPISHPHKAVFVHIPKTAGTSVEVVLGMHGDKKEIGIVPYWNQELDHEHLYGGLMQHMTAHEIRAALKNDAAFDAYFKFTIVRNPWDRLVSALAWTDQKWAKGDELEIGEFHKQVRQAHAQLVAAQSARNADGLPHYLLPQFAYIYDAEQRLLVNYIAKYENLPADWKVIGQRLGVSGELPSRMRSNHRNYREYYNDETIRLVREMYGPDINLFQYDF